MVKKQGTFELSVEEGSFKDSQIIVLLGQNGTGKTTLIKMLAGKDKEFVGKVIITLNIIIFIFFIMKLILLFHIGTRIIRIL